MQLFERKLTDDKPCYYIRFSRTEIYVVIGLSGGYYSYVSETNMLADYTRTEFNKLFDYLMDNGLSGTYRRISSIPNDVLKQLPIPVYMRYRKELKNAAV